MKIRFIDAGVVSGLRSQSIYHGLGYAQKLSTPDTIVLTTPGTPYVCIGFFQNPLNDLDIDYCREKQLPIIRRETGGGTVYIDRGQLFVQWIFQQNSLPKRVDKRFQLFIEPLVETYKFFGINAYHHPINDVHVGGKKIVGTGAGTIGEAQIVTGNFLFDFDYTTMLNAIKTPTKGFRDAIEKNLNDYLTCMKRELKQLPNRDEVIRMYKTKCEEKLGLKIEPGYFTDKELLWMQKMEDKFIDDSWLYEIKKEPSENKLFKIHLGVWIGYINYELEKGSMNALITMKGDFISEIKLMLNGLKTSDYTIRSLENILLGVKMDRKLIAQKVNSIVGEHLFNEWVDCIYKVKELKLQQSGYGTMARSN